MTLTLRVTSALLVWTSRFALSNWMARPSSCRFGTRLAKSASAPSPLPTTAAPTASS
uniref:Secreted protein n=1 Tax=Macrostomum lignano TaxID=282301 RepID=A0A1I8G459_9PLAT